MNITFSSVQELKLNNIMINITMNERKLDFRVCFEPSYSIQSCDAEVSEMSYERAHELIYG